MDHRGPSEFDSLGNVSLLMAFYDFSRIFRALLPQEWEGSFVPAGFHSGQQRWMPSLVTTVSMDVTPTYSPSKSLDQACHVNVTGTTLYSASTLPCHYL